MSIWKKLFVGKKNKPRQAVSNPPTMAKSTSITTTQETNSPKVKAESNVEIKHPSIKIGSQEWMTENLNVDRFRNGDPIPEAKTEMEWLNAIQWRKPAWCYYDNDPANGKIYGKLYNWYAAMDTRGLAPEGWHVPSDADWRKLTDYFGGTENAGGKLKSQSLWKSPNSGATNESMFSGLPGGRYYPHFGCVETYGLWWSSSERWSLSERKNVDSDYIDHAWSWILFYKAGCVFRESNNKGNGLSVRCLKD